MRVIYAEDRPQSLIWIKRPTQQKSAWSNPTDISLWPHLLVAVNDLLIRQIIIPKSSLNFPFNMENIRATNLNYAQLKKDLKIGNFDIKNLWPRFNLENLLIDFRISPEEFGKLQGNDPLYETMNEFIVENLRPNSDEDPKSLLAKISRLQTTEVESIWQQSINLVSIYVYGLVFRSFYGHVYRKKAFNGNQSSLKELKDQNERLLKLFAYGKDYSDPGRGPNDAIAVINAFHSYNKKNTVNLLLNHHYDLLIVPKQALLKEIEPVLSYFNLELVFKGDKVENFVSTKVLERVSSPNTSIGPVLVILQGPPGTGKTREARCFAKNNGIEKSIICQFHPSYSYDQFIEGIYPVSFADGTYKYQPLDGPLLSAWRKVTGVPASSLCVIKERQIDFPAGILSRYFEVGDVFHVYPTRESDVPIFEGSYDGQDKLLMLEGGDCQENELKTLYFKGVTWGRDHHELLILDELNRASAPQVFGELLYALSLVDGQLSEKDRKKESVKLQYSQENFYWPDSLHIIATLNQADRSTEDLDQALLRRFDVLNVLPDSSVLNTVEVECVKKIHSSNGTVDGLVEWLCASQGFNCSPLSKIMDSLNECLKTNESIFDADKKLLGQGNFLKIARITAKFAVGHDLNETREKFCKEFKASIISQLQVICNNNVELMADILCEAIESGSLTIPMLIVLDILNVLDEEHDLQQKFENTTDEVA